MASSSREVKLVNLVSAYSDYNETHHNRRHRLNQKQIFGWAKNGWQYFWILIRRRQVSLMQQACIRTNLFGKKMQIQLN